MISTCNYKENIECSKKYRIEQINETNELILDLERISLNKADKFFVPNYSSVKEYDAQMETYRKLFCEMLGWPLSEGKFSERDIKNDITEEIVYEDSDKTIKRLSIEIVKNISMCGVFIVPASADKNTPLIFALHGAKGCPELVCGFYGSTANYNDMAMRAVSKGFAVFVPQLHLWSEDFGPINQREELDQKLKLLGESITSFEIFKLKNALTALIRKKYTSESAPKGIMGLSYGGMYALYTAATDTRFDAVLSSCWLNEHPYEKGHADWVHINAANTFRDEQIAAMICPRELYMENGKYDERFPPYKATDKVEYIREVYSKLNVPDSFKYQLTEEGHAFDSTDNGLNWLKLKLSENFKENEITGKENSIEGVL